MPGKEKNVLRRYGCFRFWARIIFTYSGIFYIHKNFRDFLDRFEIPLILRGEGSGL